MEVDADRHARFLVIASRPTDSPPSPHAPSRRSHVKVATKSLAPALTDPGSTGVNSVSFSPNNALLAASDENGDTYLWNVATKA